jgi:hypothetical protein
LAAQRVAPSVHTFVHVVVHAPALQLCPLGQSSALPQVVQPFAPAIHCWIWIPVHWRRPAVH